MNPLVRSNATASLSYYLDDEFDFDEHEDMLPLDRMLIDNTSVLATIDDFLSFGSTDRSTRWNYMSTQERTAVLYGIAVNRQFPQHTTVQAASAAIDMLSLQEVPAVISTLVDEDSGGLCALWRALEQSEKGADWLLNALGRTIAQHDNPDIFACYAIVDLLGHQQSAQAAVPLVLDLCSADMRRDTLVRLASTRRAVQLPGCLNRLQDLHTVLDALPRKPQGYIFNHVYKAASKGCLLQIGKLWLEHDPHHIVRAYKQFISGLSTEHLAIAVKVWRDEMLDAQQTEILDRLDLKAIARDHQANLPQLMDRLLCLAPEYKQRNRVCKKLMSYAGLDMAEQGRALQFIRAAMSGTFLPDCIAYTFANLTSADQKLVITQLTDEQKYMLVEAFGCMESEEFQHLAPRLCKSVRRRLLKLRMEMVYRDSAERLSILDLITALHDYPDGGAQLIAPGAPPLLTYLACQRSELRTRLPALLKLLRPYTVNLIGPILPDALLMDPTLSHILHPFRSARLEKLDDTSLDRLALSVESAQRQRFNAISNAETSIKLLSRSRNIESLQGALTSLQQQVRSATVDPALRSCLAARDSLTPVQQVCFESLSRARMMPFKRLGTGSIYQKGAVRVAELQERASRKRKKSDQEEEGLPLGAFATLGQPNSWPRKWPISQYSHWPRVGITSAKCLRLIGLWPNPDTHAKAIDIAGRFVMQPSLLAAVRKMKEKGYEKISDLPITDTQDLFRLHQFVQTLDKRHKADSPNGDSL